MKFSAQQEVAVPADSLFDLLCDFERLEEAAHRRGIEIVRTDSPDGRVIGTFWQVEIRFRGKLLHFEMRLRDLNRPHQIVLAVTGPGLEGDLTAELKTVTPERTRLVVSAELRPGTLTARLLVKSMKLTKASLDRKFEARIAEYLEKLESRYAALQDD